MKRLEVTTFQLLFYSHRNNYYYYTGKSIQILRLVKETERGVGKLETGLNPPLVAIQVPFP